MASLRSLHRLRDHYPRSVFGTARPIPQLSKRTLTTILLPRPRPSVRASPQLLESPLAPATPSIPIINTTAAATSTFEAAAAALFTPGFRLPVHPALQALQVRHARRDTYDPSHRVRKRRHGFLARLRTRGGRMVLKRRRLKKRSTLSH